jgi:hypothetical protein
LRITASAGDRTAVRNVRFAVTADSFSAERPIEPLVPSQSDDVRLPREIAEALASEAPGFRLAEPGDYLPVLSGGNRGQPVVRDDFDADGAPDWAVLVIDERARESRVYFILDTRERLRFERLFTRGWPASAGGPAIRTPMFLKPAGSLGIAGRRYASLSGEAAAAYQARPAIEVWTGQQHDERDDDLEDLAYCSTTWYYESTQLRQFSVCD